MNRYNWEKQVWPVENILCTAHLPSECQFSLAFLSLSGRSCCFSHATMLLKPFTGIVFLSRWALNRIGQFSEHIYDTYRCNELRSVRRIATGILCALSIAIKTHHHSEIAVKQIHGAVSLCTPDGNMCKPDTNLTIVPLVWSRAEQSLIAISSRKMKGNNNYARQEGKRAAERSEAIIKSRATMMFIATICT